MTSLRQRKASAPLNSVFMNLLPDGYSQCEASTSASDMQVRFWATFVLVRSLIYLSILIFIE